jgi:hypothetical protein
VAESDDDFITSVRQSLDRCTDDAVAERVKYAAAFGWEDRGRVMRTVVHTQVAAQLGIPQPMTELVADAGPQRRAS